MYKTRIKMVSELIHFGHYIPGGPASRRRLGGFVEEASTWNLDRNVVALTLGGNSTKAIGSLSRNTYFVFDYTDDYLRAPGIARDYLRPTYHFLKKRDSFYLSTYKQRILSIIKKADVVTCASFQQARTLLKIDPTLRISIIGDNLQEIQFRKPHPAPDKKSVNFLWEGLVPNLIFLRNLLGQIEDTSKFLIKIHVVTDLCPKQDKFISQLKNEFPRLAFECYQWSVQTVHEVADLCQFGLLAINQKDGMAMSKPANKIRVYLKLGLPVVSNLNWDGQLYRKNLGSYLAQLGRNDITVPVFDINESGISSDTLLSDYSRSIFYAQEFEDRFFSKEKISNQWRRSLLVEVENA